MRSRVRRQGLPADHLLPRLRTKCLSRFIAEVPFLPFRYENKSLTQNPNGWHENERRLYVWFVICFMKLKLLDPLEFVDGYPKYWKEISLIFWGKNILFLKYQLLCLVKTKTRIVWKKDED